MPLEVIYFSNAFQEYQGIIAMLDMTNKVVAVTGGGSGIGQAVSHQFAKQGAQVYILDVAEEAGRSVRAEVEAEGGQGLSTCM